MNEILVSVIVPVYNVEAYLKQCLDSIASQTLPNIEVICVDDGSTDSSLEILENYSKSDSRFSVVKQQNRFAGVARNNGISRAKGKYLVFWDSDDFFEPNALETMVSKCEKEHADVCLCAAYEYDTASNEKHIAETFMKKRFLPNSTSFSKDDYGKYLFNIVSNTPWQRMLKRDFVVEHGLQFQDLRHANDTYFSMMSMFYAKKITFTTKALINYRVNNSESLTGKASKDPFCALHAYESVYKKLIEENASSEVIQSFKNRLLSGLIRAIKTQSNIESKQQVFDKIKLDSFSLFEIDFSNPDYYYFKNDFNELSFINNQSFNEYLEYIHEQEVKKSENAKKESKLIVKLARKLSVFVKPDSKLFDIAKKILHFN